MRDVPSGSRLVLMGHFGFGNVGDDAILLGTLSMLREQLPGAQYSIVSRDPEATRALDPLVDVVDEAHPQAVLDAVRGADLVILGGGGLFHDYHGMNPLAVLQPREAWARMLYSYPLVAAMLGRPMMMLGLGVGPLPHPEGRGVVAHTARMFDLITVRDVQSRSLLLELGVPESRVFLAADPAFWITPAPPSAVREIMAREGLEPGGFLAVVVRPWDVPGAPSGWASAVAGALEAFGEEARLPLVFIPFQVQGVDDRAAASQVMAAMRGTVPSKLLPTVLDPRTLVGVLREARLVVGMRLHAVILAAVAGTPAVGLAYDPKVGHQMEKLGAADLCVALADSIADRLQGAMRAAWTRGDALGRGLRAAAGRERARAAISARLAAMLVAQSWRSGPARQPGDPHPPAPAEVADAVRGDEMAIAHPPGPPGDRHRAMEAVQAVLDRLSEQCQRAEDLARALRLRIADLESALAEARREGVRHEQAAAALAEELRVVYSLRRWRVASWFAGAYWSLRRILAGQELRARAHNAGRRILPRPVRAALKRVRPWDASRAGPVADGTGAGEPRAVGGRTVPGAGYDILYFPVIDWDFRLQRSQHLCTQFAEHGHRVFYVRTTFARRREGHGGAGSVAIRTIRDRVFDVQLPGPGSMNVYRDRPDQAIVDDWVAFLDALRRQERLCHVVCIVALPFWTRLALRLREHFGWKVVYDCMDDHAGFATNEPAMVADEVELATHSDLVVTTSRVLRERLSPHAARMVHLPNACQFEHFHPVPAQRPHLYHRVRRPVVGYYGAISAWFDVNLVAALAARRPDWSFVLIGRTAGADVGALEGLANVHLLGEISYGDLPGHLHAFDVCLIPFVRDRLTDATDPVKLYEYLSAGKPVVASPLPELQSRAEAGLLYTAQTVQQYIDAIERALEEDGAVRREQRVAYARQHTWAARYEALARSIAQCFPKVSIVIVTHDNLPLTRACLESLWQHTVYPHVEVIVVDNASADGTPDYLQAEAERHANLRVIRNAENRGFAAATNQGILATAGDYLVLLNNDTVVTRGWLGRLLSHLDRDPSVGMVGPVTNATGNEACIEVSYGGLDDMHAFAARYALEHEAGRRELEVLAMYCVAMRRAVVQEVGLLDERFGVGLFEDDDYAHRLRALGYRLICAEDVFIHHAGRSAFGRLDGPVYDALFERNRALFERKWGVVWRRHRRRDDPRAKRAGARGHGGGEV